MTGVLIKRGDVVTETDVCRVETRSRLTERKRPRSRGLGQILPPQPSEGPLPTP